MNDTRRKTVREQVTKLEEIKGSIESLKDEEEEYLESMPDNMKEGEKGDKTQTNIAHLEDALINLEQTLDELTSIE